MGEKLLSRREVAEMFDVPERTLASWAYQGMGPTFYKIGKHARYRLRDVEAWLSTRARLGDGSAA